MITVTRFHDFSAGHRVHGHENVCAHLHGHNYRVHFTVGLEGRWGAQGTVLDSVGRVIDFAVVKGTLCQWLEKHWDHRMLISYKDPLVERLHALDPEGVYVVPFNPTAENMASYLLNIMGPEQLKDYVGLQLIEVTIDETRKCSATASKDFTVMMKKEDER